MTTQPTPQICPDCNGAGGDNNVWCCPRCNGSGGIITIEVGIPNAQRIIQALHEKEQQWYERAQKSASQSASQYSQQEQARLATIRKNIERLMP